MNDSYQIVSPQLTVKAMRDSGYKSTAHALAELIDNSIDADATLVELFVCEEPKQVNTQTRRRVDTIAVLDNGKGMDSDTLRRALKYGDGTRDTRPRIGKFGMGLPNSSMSQCRKVEVWSWTNGPENAFSTHLELEQISKGLMTDVPQPRHDPVPEYWQELGLGFSTTGTLVVWSDLDRVQWFGADATLRNTEQLIGRVYRHFLDRGQLRIRLVPVGPGGVVEGPRDATPNDPLYLMAPSCTPEPFAHRPMFEPLPMGTEDEPGEVVFPIEHKGVKRDVIIRAGMASLNARDVDSEGANWPERYRNYGAAGNHPWGKHADRNVGISLIREGREIDLDRSWTISYDPRERWWGIEVEFPSELDDVFGVTNTKQSATIFSSLSSFDWNDERLPDESLPTCRLRLQEAEDPRLPLIALADQLKRTAGHMRDRVKETRRGTRSGGKRHGSYAEEAATGALNRRREEAHLGETDRLEESTPADDIVRQQVDSLVHSHGVQEEEAAKVVAEGRRRNMRARWASSKHDSPAFFSVESLPAMLQVAVNSNHPVHDELMSVLEDAPEGADAAELRTRLFQAAETVRLLLFSWARYEDETPEGREKDLVKNARYDWGRLAREFLQKEGQS